jgi:transposase
MHVSGAPWRDLPERYRPRTTCYNWFRSTNHTAGAQRAERVVSRTEPRAVPSRNEACE